MSYAPLRIAPTDEDRAIRNRQALRALARGERSAIFSMQAADEPDAELMRAFAVVLANEPRYLRVRVLAAIIPDTCPSCGENRALVPIGMVHVSYARLGFGCRVEHS